MRDYSKVRSRFWIAGTGKALRGDPHAQLVALYLMTSPHANMIGLYYLPLHSIAHETGLTTEGASKALRRLSEGGFAHYSEEHEVVFVPAMAREQVEEQLSAADKRCKGIANELEAYIKTPFYNEFLKLYHKAFNLPEPKPLASPFEAPCKPLRSQAQEQEQEQEQKNLAAMEPAATPGLPGLKGITRQEALNAIATASGGRFVASPPGKGGVFKLDKARKASPDGAVFQRIGEWLAAGGDAWRGKLDGRALGDSLDAWIAQSAAWDGKPIASARNGAPDPARGKAPVSDWSGVQSGRLL